MKMYPSRINHPEYLGYIIPEMIKCGKWNCKRCPHGPYYYLYYRELISDQWKLNKRYVKRGNYLELSNKIKHAKNEDLMTSFFENPRDEVLLSAVLGRVDRLSKEELMERFGDILKEVKKSYSPS